jgi:hypothetical protein
MGISALTLKLIILLAPGVLAATIHKQLTVRHKEPSNFMFMINAIMLGLFSYLSLQLLFNFFALIQHICHNSAPLLFTELKTFKNIALEGDIPYSEIIWASILSIGLGVLVTKADNKKWVTRIASRIKVSNKYGEENLFSYFLNDDDIEWVYVRDLENKLTYMGCVKIFSETEDFKELVLERVSVMDYPDCNDLYDIDRIYLCFPKDKVIIEQANLEPQENDKK